VTLTNEILERLRPIFAREDDVAHAGVRLADWRAGVAFERGGDVTCRSYLEHADPTLPSDQLHGIHATSCNFAVE
jgi:hypothetical protein